MKNILVTTEHRGVWFAQVDDNMDLSTSTLKDLKNAKMAIYFNTKKGLQELCEIGPNSGSRIGAVSDILILHKVTAVFAVSEKAAERWLES